LQLNQLTNSLNTPPYTNKLPITAAVLRTTRHHVFPTAIIPSGLHRKSTLLEPAPTTTRSS
jgi:hypothetical protein